MLNHTQVKELFVKEAVLFGSVDGVPVFRAKKLFGPAAVEFVTCQGLGGTHYNVYDVNDRSIGYLQYCGFQLAATFCNIEEIHVRECVEE